MNTTNHDYAPTTWADRRTACRYLGISKSTLKRKEAKGEIVGRKDCNGMMRFCWKVLDDYAARNGIVPDQAVRAEMGQEQEEPDTDPAPVAPQGDSQKDARPASDGNTGTGDAEALKLGVARAFEYIRKSDGREYADIVHDGVPALDMTLEEFEEHLGKYLAVGGKLVVLRPDYERLFNRSVKNAEELFSTATALVRTANTLADQRDASRKQARALEESLQQKGRRIAELEGELDQANLALENSNMYWRQAADDAQRASDALGQVQAELSERTEQIEQLENERDRALAEAEQSAAWAREEEKRRIDLERQLTTAQAALAVSQDLTRAAQAAVLAAQADVNSAQTATRSAQAHARDAQITADGAQQYAERAQAAVALAQSMAADEVRKLKTETNALITAERQAASKNIEYYRERADLVAASEKNLQAKLSTLRPALP